MLRILLILLICNNVISNEEESNKYIDLLPEKEKREFLDRIARRILEEIKSKGDPNTSHAEISDEQLDAQAAFVQGILKEESENLKKRRRDNKDTNVAEDLQVKVDNKEDNENQDRYIDLTLRTGVRRKRNYTNVVPLERTETTSELPIQTVLVETIYDQGPPTNTLDNRSSEDLNTIITQTSESISENITEPAPTSAETGHNPTIQYFTSSSTPNQKNLRKSFLNEVESPYRTTLLTDFEPNSEETSLEIDTENVTTTSSAKTVSEIQTQEYNYSTTVSETVWGSTQKIYEPEGHTYKHYDEITENITTKVGTTIEPTSFVTLNSSAETSKLLTLETTTEAFTTPGQPNNETLNRNALRNNLVLSENKNHDITMDRDKHDVIDKVEKSVSDNVTRDHRSTKIEQGNSTTSEVILLEKQKSTATQSVDIELRENRKTSSIPVKVTSLIKEEVELAKSPTPLFNRTSDDGQIHNKSLKGESNLVDTKSVKALDNSKKYLRSDFVPLEQETIETVTPKKEYEVYEIDVNKPAFFKSTKFPKIKQEEQPHYANIYNYDPSNAYFDPNNRFGPNTKSSEEPIQSNDLTVKGSEEIKNKDYQIDKQNSNLNLRSRFHGYNKKDHAPVVNNPRPKVTKNMKDFMNVFKKVTSDNTIYFHAYDYPDYYLERADRPRKSNSHNDKKGFPDSSEYDHPYNFLHQSESIKDHIRAARYLLYLQKRFGYVPVHEKPVFRNKTAVNETAKNKNMRYYENEQNERGLKHMSKPAEIAMDYYYDRDAGEVISEEHERELKKYKSLKTRVASTENTKHKNIESNYNSNLNTSWVKTKNKDDETISYKSLLVVLGDMIKLDNDDLINYNWLKTTVDVRAAIEKVHGLIDDFHFGNDIHPKDLQLLKYIFYLYKSSKLKLATEETVATDNTMRKKGVLPRNKRKKRIKQPLQVMKDFFSFIRDQNIDPDDQPFMVLHELEDLLNEVVFQLDDFHSALQRIAQSSTHRTYNWYNSLKNNVFKNASKRKLGQVLLHLAVYNLLDLIDDSARSGLENSFKHYVKQNPEVVDATRNEFIFVLQILQKLRHGESK